MMFRDSGFGCPRFTGSTWYRIPWSPLHDGGWGTVLDTDRPETFAASTNACVRPPPKGTRPEYTVWPIMNIGDWGGAQAVAPKLGEARLSARVPSSHAALTFDSA